VRKGEAVRRRRGRECVKDMGERRKKRESACVRETITAVNVSQPMPSMPEPKQADNGTKPCTIAET
jgi:hypothetical protein